MVEKNPKDTIPGICMVCAIVKSSGSLCELHKKGDDSLEGCDVCSRAVNYTPLTLTLLFCLNHNLICIIMSY